MASFELPSTPATSGVSERPVTENPVKDESSSSTRASSPDPSCPICLDNVFNPAYTDMCCHRFCFHCLVSWSRIKPECPLCKQRFSLIIHNVRSIGDYDELPVTWAEPAPPSLDANFFISVAFQRPRFRFRTTGGSGAWSGLRFQHLLRGPNSQEHLPSPILTSPFPPSNSITPPVSLPPSTLSSSELPSTNIFTGNTVPTALRRRRQISGCEFRSNVYRQNMWIRPPERRPGVPYRVRECSPTFYRDNPAQINRLLPWLHRELLVLLDVRHDYEEVCMRIVHAITNIPIRSPRFRAMMWPYLHERTLHFCHEFYYFATAPYDLLAYDITAQYVRRDEFDPEIMFQSDHENDQNTRHSDSSDIEIIEPEAGEVIEISDDNNDVVTIEYGGNESDNSVEIISELPPLAEREHEVIDLVADSGPDCPPSPTQSNTANQSCNEDKRERVIDRLRNKFQPYYKDESTSSEEESPPRRPQRKRKRKSKPVKLRKPVVEDYLSSDSDSSYHTLDYFLKRHKSNESVVSETVQTRSKTKYQESTSVSSSHSEDKSSSGKSGFSSHSNTEISGPSSSRCKRKRTQPSSSRYKSKKKKTSSSHMKCLLKNETPSVASSPPRCENDVSPSYLDPCYSPYNISELKPEIENHSSNRSDYVFEWPSTVSCDEDLVMDEKPLASPATPSSQKPRLKSVVRKVGLSEEPSSSAGCSTWSAHNLRQRKLTKNAYTPYLYTLSDSDS